MSHRQWVRGERQGLAKMTEAGVLDARSRRSAGERVDVLAAEYGVSRSTMSSLLSGNTWRHLS